MRLYELDTEKAVLAALDRFWEIAQNHKPELKELMDRALADNDLDRPDLLRLGFHFGAGFVIAELADGNIREMHNG